MEHPSALQPSDEDEGRALARTSGQEHLAGSPVRVELVKGARLLVHCGIVVVKATARHGVDVETVWGERLFIGFDQLVVAAVTDQGIAQVEGALEPFWSALSDDARAEALFRLEVLMECKTGFRLGFPYLRLKGEPFAPFDDPATSWTERTNKMAERIGYERSMDRSLMRRVHEGGLANHTITGQTIRNWYRRWLKDGILGLVSGHKTRAIREFADLDPRLFPIADQEFGRFDGTTSEVALLEIKRRIDERFHAEHQVSLYDLPHQPLIRQYLSKRYKGLGKGTRAHASRAHRSIASKSNYPILHPAHIVCDVTRVDGFVWDKLFQRPISVECSVFMSVSSRVVLSVRVTPMSSRAADVSLGLFDACRPQSILVAGATVDDVRWAGIPESIEWAANPTISRRRLVDGAQGLQGTHWLPGLAPSSLRSDKGTIYMSREFRALLAHWGIDHYPSRGKKPTDNPQVERQFDGWVQRAIQEYDGFKGRCVFERGRLVVKADTPLMTWRELETYLRLYAATVYHRHKQDGLTFPGLDGLDHTPLEAHDHLMGLTGRITVPQHPDLIFDFLPVRWLKLGSAGVEYKGITYDGDVLDSIGLVRPGTYRDRDDKIPFIVDPRDPLRIWHRSREDGRIHELIDRGAHKLDQPLMSLFRDYAIAQVQARGGNKVVSREHVRREITATFGSLAKLVEGSDARDGYSAAYMRLEQAQIDHAEVAAARAQLADSATAPKTGKHLCAVPVADADSVPTGADDLGADDEWPDYDAQGF